MSDNDLEQFISDREATRPGFRQRVDDALQRQRLGRELAQLRQTRAMSQTQVAARMETSASIVSRLESGSDVRISTLEKYSAALGMRLEVRLLPNKARRPRPPSKQGARAGRRARKGADPVNESATG